MEVKDLLDLVKAGFTKEEILALSANESAQRPVAAETEQEPVHAEEPAPAAVDEELRKEIASLNETMNEFREQIRKQNLLSAVIPGGAVEQPTADDLIARIINPNSKKEV